MQQFSNLPGRSAERAGLEATKGHSMRRLGQTLKGIDFRHKLQQCLQKTVHYAGEMPVVRSDRTGM